MLLWEMARKRSVVARKEKLENGFEKFHTENPRVWELFKKFTFEAIGRGHKTYSADAIVHRVRWETSIVTNEEFKINNNHVAFYARLFMDTFPEYRGFFRTREQETNN